MPKKSKMLWVALAILIGVVCFLQPALANAQMTSVGIDCSEIQALHLMEQDNMGASRVLIECGIVPGGHPADPDSLPAGQAADEALRELERLLAPAAGELRR